MITDIGRKLLSSTKFPTKFRSKKYCVTFIKKGKQTVFGNINITDATYNKTFCQKVKPFLTEVKTRSKITSTEKKEGQKTDVKKVTMKEVISNDYDISETSNKFFSNLVPNSKIMPNENFETVVEYEIDPVENAVEKFKNHPYMKMIIFKINPNKRYSFCLVSYDEILKQIKSLDT